MTDFPRRPGRRPGAPDTRACILHAAREIFAAKGLQAATLREIARAAGVDPALISHYFGNKRGLFLRAIELPLDPEEIVAPLREVPPDHLAETVLRILLDAWDSQAGPAAVAAFRSAIDHGEEKVLRSFVADLVFEPLRERLTAQDRLDLRLSLFASQLAGLLLLRKVVRMEPVASTPGKDLVPLIAPSLQRYLTGELPGT